MTDYRNLSLTAFSKETGHDLKLVREWVKRLNDPLPTVPAGTGGKGIRQNRKVVMSLYPEWIERNHALL